MAEGHAVIMHFDIKFQNYFDREHRKIHPQRLGIGNEHCNSLLSHFCLSYAGRIGCGKEVG